MKTLRLLRAVPTLFLLLASVAGPGGATPVHAATGDVAGGVNFSQQCNSGLGVGITFDGADLWFSCYGGSPDLIRANPTTGATIATYNIAGGLGSLAYDATRNAIWAGPGGGSFNNGLEFITLDANKVVTGSSFKFGTPEAAAGGCGLDDGLGLDGATDILYVSYDCSRNIYEYAAASGVFLTAFPWNGSGCYNSGVAIGGSLLFEGSDGCNHVWVVDKVTKAPAFDFSTTIAGDSNFRDESLTCDPVTFAAQGKQVMWSKEAYSPMRAHAFEIPAGTCGFGGQPVDKTPPNCALTASGVNNSGQKYLQITVQDSDGGLKSVQVTEDVNAVVTWDDAAHTIIQLNGFAPVTPGDTSAHVVTATKTDQSLGASVGLQVTDTAGNVTNCDPSVGHGHNGKGKGVLLGKF